MIFHFKFHFTIRSPIISHAIHPFQSMIIHHFHCIFMVFPHFIHHFRYSPSTSHGTKPLGSSRGFPPRQPPVASAIRPRGAAELQEMTDFVAALRQNLEALLIRHFPESPMRTGELTPGGFLRSGKGSPSRLMLSPEKNPIFWWGWWKKKGVFNKQTFPYWVDEKRCFFLQFKINSTIIYLVFYIIYLSIWWQMADEFLLEKKG